MNTDSNIAIFNNDSFGDLRVVMQGGEPWFVALDVCRVLEYRDTNDATKYLDVDEVATCPDNSSGQLRHVRIISEAGLYSLILRSRKPEAKTFKRWVTHDVLPSIRRDGGYLTPEMVEKASSILIPPISTPVLRPCVDIDRL